MLCSFTVSVCILIDAGSFVLWIRFKFGISNEITKFPMNLQNSTLEISASLMTGGTQIKVIWASF